MLPFLSSRSPLGVKKSYCVPGLASSGLWPLGFSFPVPLPGVPLLPYHCPCFVSLGLRIILTLPHHLQDKIRLELQPQKSNEGCTARLYCWYRLNGGHGWYSLANWFHQLSLKSSPVPSNGTSRDEEDVPYLLCPIGSRKPCVAIEQLKRG